MERSDERKGYEGIKGNRMNGYNRRKDESCRMGGVDEKISRHKTVE